MALQFVTKNRLARIDESIQGEPTSVDGTKTADLDLPYDIGFTAGFNKDMGPDPTKLVVGIYGQMVMGRAGTFVGEAGYVTTVATGAILIVDVMKNGTTIYASTKPQFAISATGLTAGVLTVTTFAAGDRITFKVTQIGSTSAGAGIYFTLKCKV